MPYIIETKDGISVGNIPDNIAQDDPQLKSIVENARAKGEKYAYFKTEVQAEEEQVTPLKGFVGKVTGESLQTPETQALSNWADMPEMAQMTNGMMPAAKTALGAAFSSPEEIAQIVQSNFPNVAVRQDAKGNYVMQSPSDGKEYVIQPGWFKDPIRGGGAIAEMGAGLAGRIPVMVASKMASPLVGAIESGGLQAGIEGLQAATGGEFNPLQVATAGALGGAIPAVSNIGKGTADIPVVAKEAITEAKLPPEQIESIGGADQQSAFGDLLKKAASGDEKATRELALLTNVNKEAKKAADDLGLYLPLDVLSDNPFIKSLAGQERSIRSSDAELNFDRAIERAASDADTLLKGLGFTRDLDGVNTKVFTTLDGSLKAMGNRAEELYKKVDDSIKPETPASLDNLTQLVEQIKIERPGIRTKGEDNQIFDLVERYKNTGKEGVIPPTYAELSTERSMIGKAMRGGNSPYSTMDDASLKRIYAALSEDKTANVAATEGGEMLVKDMKRADQIWKKKAELQDKLISVYGTNLNGSITKSIKASLEGGKKGDVTALNKILAVIPKSMRGEALGSALLSAATSRAHPTKGMFGFNQYADMYRQLRENPAIYNLIIAEMPKGADETLRSLYIVSNRIAQATARKDTTGKSMQALTNSITANNLIEKVVNGGLYTVAKGGNLIGAGSMTTGLANAAAKAINVDSASKMKAVNDLLKSQEFADLAINAVKEKPTKRDIMKLITSKTWNNYAKQVGMKRDLKNYERWVSAALQPVSSTSEEE